MPTEETPDESCTRWPLRRAAAWNGAALLVTAALLPPPAAAQLEMSPYAGAALHHNSNVFDFSGRDEALANNGTTTLADTVWRARAGLDLTYALSNQQLSASIEGRRFGYERFTQLDRDEYLWSAALDWHVGSAYAGRVDVRQERRLAGFADRNTTALTLERERAAGATLAYRPGASWRYDLGVRTRNLLTPLPLFPKFALDERIASAGVRYLGTGPATFGIVAEYLDGEFDGTPSNDAFDQTTLELAADYAVSGLSQLRGRLGYTRRDESIPGRDDVSAVTGSLGMRRTLSGVTALDFEAFRRVSSFTAGPQSLIEMGVRIGIDWRPSVFIISAGVQHAESEFQLPSAAQQRTDRTQTAYARLGYGPTPWLQLQPYYEYRNRDSNLRDERYSGSIVGLELTARFGMTDEPLIPEL